MSEDEREGLYNYRLDAYAYEVGWPTKVSPETLPRKAVPQKKAQDLMKRSLLGQHEQARYHDQNGNPYRLNSMNLDSSNNST